MSQDGFIYAIGAEGTPFVKIGSTSIAVEQRLKQLQTGQPQRLYIIAVIAVERIRLVLEKQIHRILAEHKQGGEWFDVPMDLATLKRLMGQAMRQIQESRRYLFPTVPQEAEPLPQEAESLPLVYQRMSFGARVAAVRRLRACSQSTLAEKAGLPLETIERIENGLISEPSLHMALALAKALGKCMNFMTGVFAEEYHHTWGFWEE